MLAGLYPGKRRRKQLNVIASGQIPPDQDHVHRRQLLVCVDVAGRNIDIQIIAARQISAQHDNISRSYFLILIRVAGHIISDRNTAVHHVDDQLFQICIYKVAVFVGNVDILRDPGYGIRGDRKRKRQNDAVFDILVRDILSVPDELARRDEFAWLCHRQYGECISV